MTLFNIPRPQELVTIAQYYLFMGGGYANSALEALGDLVCATVAFPASFLLASSSTIVACSTGRSANLGE
jgi:hypothetical protein